jgi:aminoglycoside phosphotransferase (APT) family kinase protein
MNWLDIDPDLPTLPFAFDVNSVAQRFEQHWPARPITASPRVTVKECRRQDVHYIPATRCVMTYTLLVEQAGLALAGSTPEQTIGVVEVTPAGLNHRLFMDDAQLSGLAMAVDVDAMRERFMALREEHGQAGVVQACTVTPVRYKPGTRCAFRYDLHTLSGQESCFGKLLARNSTQLWQTIVALYQAGQRPSAEGAPSTEGVELELPRIAQPLAYWPELQMLVQAAVAGVELHTVAFDPQLDAAARIDWLRAAGRCSAALHTLTSLRLEPASPEATARTGLEGPQRTLTDDLADLDEYRPALRQVNPGLANRFEETIAAIIAIAQRQTELTPVLSHGALRTDQFMIENGQLVLIDLDSVCWANPARDLGNFLAYLTWKAMRQPQHAAFIQSAEQAFLEGYARLRALPDADWLALYQAASLLKILGRRYSGLTYQEWPLTEQLLDRAIRMMKI